MESLANNPWIKSNQLTLDEKLEFLQYEVERSGHKSMMIADTNGIAKNTTGETVDIHDRDYFKKALSGQNTVSDPLISKTDGSLVIQFAVPIKHGDTVTGVLIARRDGNELSNYTNEMLFNDREVYMINKEGTSVADKDQSLVSGMYNTAEEYIYNSDLEELYNLEKKMADGEQGVGEYTFDGVTKYMGYCPVEGTNWSLAVTAPKSVVMSKIYNLTKMMTTLSVLFLLISIIITMLIARNISKPIKETTMHLNVMSTGDFTADVPRKLLDKQDEIGSLANSLDKMRNSIRAMMKSVMDECANVEQMLIDVNRDMSGLNESIEEISATTEELSAGAEETAASSEEMNATSIELEHAIESVASKAQEGAATVSKVSKMSEEMKQNAISSKQEVLKIYSKAKKDLQIAIEEAKAVNQINELSNVITTIAEKTNTIVSMADHVVNLANISNKKSEQLIEQVKQFKI